MSIKSFWQVLVRDFHEKFGRPLGKFPGDNFNNTDIMNLRCALITEEALEFNEAVKQGDLAKTIDALCDILYVTFGAAETIGVNLAPFYMEVHRSNMDKVGGGIRADGKILKPSNWTPPDIASILAREQRDQQEATRP